MSISASSLSNESLSVLACAESLSILRSLSDGEFATPQEIAHATFQTEARVRELLPFLIEKDFVHTMNGKYRENKKALVKAVNEIHSLLV